MGAILLLCHRWEKLEGGIHWSQDTETVAKLGQETQTRPASPLVHTGSRREAGALGSSCNSVSLSAVSSLQSSPDFSTFPKLEQPEEDKYSKPTAPPLSPSLSLSS